MGSGTTVKLSTFLMPSDMAQRLQRSKYFKFSLIFAVVFVGLTLYEVISTVLSFIHLVRASREARQRELNGEEVILEDTTPDGIRIELLTAEELEKLPNTIMAIIFVALTEISICIILMYGIISQQSLYVICFIGYVIVFALFKAAAVLYKVLIYFANKAAGKAINILVLSLLSSILVLIMLIVMFNYYAEIEGKEQFSGFDVLTNTQKKDE